MKTFVRASCIALSVLRGDAIRIPAFSSVRLATCAPRAVMGVTPVGPAWQGGIARKESRASSAWPAARRQWTALHSTTPEAAADGATAEAAPPAAARAAVAPAAAAPAAKKAPGKVTLALYFGGWYLGNIFYNLYNKRMLNALPLPWIMASVQLGVGLLYVLPLWATGLRKAPELEKGSLKPLSQLAFLHMCAHVTAVLSLGAGAVSFTHIVKAAEPVFTAGFSALLLGQVFALPVYLSLIPVIFGVGLASLKELSFSWLAFGTAMGSNTASALRGIIGKKQMGKPKGKNMDAANLYAVLTIIAFCMLTPAALLVEGAKAPGLWQAALAKGATAQSLTVTAMLSGIFYYLYNEVAFLALDSVHPVTHAVGNTIKRVVVIVSAVIAFRTPMTRLSVIGSAVAIVGTLLYSLVKQKYDKK